MGKKKKKGKGQRGHQSGGGQAGGRERSDSPIDPPLFPDSRMLENMSWQLAAQPGRSFEEIENAEAARLLMGRAFEARSPSHRAKLARQALQLSADCTDAYVVLAEQASTTDEALELLSQAVAAGERQLGPRGFRKYAGYFWDALETRPYMRALEGLAACLWNSGKRDEAVARYWKLLELNPDDHQGIRYLLASALLDLEHHDELQKLLDRYPDDIAAEWPYCRALLAFRQEGDSERSRKLLREAAEQNPHVARYVTGAEPLPRPIPDHFALGSEEEAVCYTAHYLPAWKDTPGATIWMRKTLNVALPEPPRQKRPSWNQLKKALAQLPQDAESVWEVDLRPLEATDETGQPTHKLWALVIVSDSDRGLLAMDLLSERPADREVWDELVQVMRHPEDNDPARPAEIRVTRKTWHRHWQSKLEQIGVQCRLVRQLKHVDYALEETLPPMDMLNRLAAGASSGEACSDLESLPQQVGEIWQAEVRRLPSWIEVEGQLRRPWICLVVDVETEMILATELREDDPTPDWIWAGVRQAMCAPAVGPPHRPGVVQVRSLEQSEQLSPPLEDCGVRCVASDESEPIQSLLDDLSAHLVGTQQMSALVNVPNVTREQVGSFFEAAAAFYRARPWRNVPADSVIQLRSPHFRSGPWYVVVMGQSGLELGLALYEDLDVLRTILQGDLSDEETGRRTTGLSITYGEEFEIAPQDVDAAEEHGWPIAGPEAYPSAMRINPGVSFRAPLAWELRLLEACLRAIPEFVTETAAGSHDAPRTLHVTTESEPVELELQWLDDLGEPS